MHEEKGSGGSATMEMLSPTTKGRAAQSSCGNVRQRLCCTRTPSLLTQRIREAVEANATMLPQICKVSTMLQKCGTKNIHITTTATETRSTNNHTNACTLHTHCCIQSLLLLHKERPELKKTPTQMQLCAALLHQQSRSIG